MMHSMEDLGEETDVTVFISCFNEQDLVVGTIAGIVRTLNELGLSHDVIVIDDASEDDSTARVRQYIEDNPAANVTLKVNGTRRGLAFNFVEGAYLGRGRFYRLICGDHGELWDKTKLIFTMIGQADIIIPWRDFDEGRTFFRRATSKMFTRVVNVLSGRKLRYYNGCAVYRRKHVVRWHPHSYGFGFQADLITQLLDQGCTFVEVESVVKELKGGRSNAMDPRSVLSVVHTMAEIGIRRLRTSLYGQDDHLVKD